MKDQKKVRRTREAEPGRKGAKESKKGAGEERAWRWGGENIERRKSKKKKTLTSVQMGSQKSGHG